jgi:hypothetical protein
MPRLPIRAAAVATMLALATSARAGTVTLNGAPLPGAEASVEASPDVVEQRDQAAADGPATPNGRYDVCILTPQQIKVLDAEEPRRDAPGRYTIGLAEGGELSGCVVTSLTVDGVGAARRMAYCLRCDKRSKP